MKYIYVKNLQGDVLHILDNMGNVVVSYAYDAWGKVYSVTGSLADTLGTINPIRYRSYYYDNETGFYYLNSRYYNPEVKRFINADGVIGANQDLTSYNLYAYCGNNPINRADSEGQAWWHIALACVAVVALCAITIAAAPAVAAAAASIGIITTASAVATTAATVGCLAIGIGVVSTGAAIAETMPKVTAPSWSKSKAKEKEDVQTLPPKSPDTVIYRYGKTNPGNLTPKQKDSTTGLSFSITPPAPGTDAAVTTIEALNATGVVCAVKDGDTHVSVRPVGVSIQTWIDSGSNSIWTQAVKSVVVKWDGTVQ